MPQVSTSSSVKTKVSSERNIGDFLDTHPCGPQILKAVNEQGIAEVHLDNMGNTPQVRKRKPR